MISVLTRSEFARNVATLMSGTVLAQMLPILLSPVMTRIFSPSDYGVLGLYMAISGILNVLVTSQYNHAIMLPDSDDDSINIIGVCYLIAIFASIFVFLIVILFSRQICSLFDSELLKLWLFLLPCSVMMSGCYSALNYWTNRKCKYKRLAISRIGQALISVSMQITLGLLYHGATGLLIGLLAGQLTSTLILLFQVWQDDKALFLKYIKLNSMRNMAISHRLFAFYLLPADFINAFNNQVPSLLLTKLAGISEVGKYNFTQRILGLPSSLISSSLVDVFKQRAISDYNSLGNCRAIYVKTFKTLSFLGFFPLLVILLAAPDIFDLVFGAVWREAGEYAQILSVMFYLRFVISPLSYVYYIAGRQKEDFVLHVIMLVGTACSLYLGYLLFKSPKYMMLFFSVSYSFIYLIYLFRSYTFAKGQSLSEAY